MVSKSYWEARTEETQAALKELGVDTPASMAQLVAEIRELGPGPQMEARAKLDLILTGAINDGIKGLVKATWALVKSSDENTKTMSTLARRLNWLTGVYVALTAALVFFAGVQIWLVRRGTPPPIVIPAPVVNVPAPVVQVVTPTMAPKPGGQPKK
jgi:hypothetical protein